MGGIEKPHRISAGAHQSKTADSRSTLSDMCNPTSTDKIRNYAARGGRPAGRYAMQESIVLVANIIIFKH